MARHTLDLGGWCILRMTSAETLRVRDGLAKMGFDVWTPTERKTGRMPRTRTAYDKEFALMPSYVFANVSHLDDLLRISMLPHSDNPRFTMFRYQGGIPLIDDSQLAALRAEEDRRAGIFERLKRKVRRGPVLDSGEHVRMTEGGFAGLSGIVEDMQGQYALVSFPGYHTPIKISSLLLQREADVGSKDEAA